MFRLIISILVFTFVTNTFSFTPGKELTGTDLKKLIICIESENDGVRSWGVYFAGKYQVAGATDFLIKVLNKDSNLCIRKLAAYALYRIGDSKGLRSLKDSADFNESTDMRKLCLTLYYASLSPSID